MANKSVDPESLVEEVEPIAQESSSLITDTPSETTAQPVQDVSILFYKLYAVVFFLNLGFLILGPAQIQIYERIYCDQWYREHPSDPMHFSDGVPESLCKIAPIQQQVSTLKGWQESIGAAPALLVTIPMGMLTDVYGRRILGIVTLASLSLAQFWSTFVISFGGRIPLQAIWWGSLFNFFGGGSVGAELLLVCILTDISGPEGLTVAFFRVTSFGAFSKIIGPVIAAMLMRLNPWCAIYTGLCVLVLTTLIVVSFPETLHSRREGTSPDLGQSRTIREELSRFSWKDTRESLGDVFRIWSDWRLVFVALTYPFRMVCYALGDLIQRYVSDRYGWTLADATLMYSIQAIGSGVMLFTLLPWVSDYIDKNHNWSAIQKNVVLSRVSLLTLVFAYGVIGLAPTAPIMIIGLLIETLATGLPATMRALASALVEGADKGRVFSVLAVVETISAMVAYPLSAAFFNLGLQKGGGAWLGLPYDTIAIGAAVSFLAMCLLRFDRRISL